MSVSLRNRGAWRGRAVFPIGLLAFCIPGAALAQSTWQQLNPSNAPPARAAQMMAYDPVSGKTVMFGGYTATSYLNDTWVFDGTTWTQVTGRVAPLPRAAGTLVYDGVEHELVLFGGYNGLSWLGDTWVFDGAHLKWTAKKPKTNPTAGTGPMGFQDPATGHAAFFGGYNGRSGLYSLDTWEWDGRNWSKIVTQTSPYARAAGIIGNDLVRGRVVIYGGIASVNPINTWTFDGTDWQQESPAQQPDVSYDAASAWDPGLQMVVAWGDSGTTWAWTGSDWTAVPTTTSPAPRSSPSMAFDEHVGHDILFGGEDASTQYNDTWEFLGAP